MSIKQATLPISQAVQLSLRESGVLVAAVNRPQKFNSWSLPVYHGLIETFRFASQQKDVKAVLLTGNGKLYSAGLDFEPEFMERCLRKDPTVNDDVDVWKELVNEMITFPKLMVAAVNGSAFGIGVTTLGLADLVYSVDDATFRTPFTALGVAAEGTSSHVFPKLLPPSLAARMLYLAETIPASELHRVGFITKLYPNNPEFLSSVLNELSNKLSPLYSSTIEINKSLMRPRDEKEKLLEVNRKEMDWVKKGMVSDEFGVTLKAKLDSARRKQGGSKL